jgi:Transposase DDE domain
MDGFDKEVLRRVPLAHATLSLFSYTLNEPFLDEIFRKHRRRGYEALLKFPTLVRLIGDALLVHQGRGLPSFRRADEKGELPVLIGSVYPKLARIETAVSQALLRESSMKMCGLFDHPASPVPGSLTAFQVITLDGKTIKNVRRQLKQLRPLRGKLLGGKLCVAQDLHTGIALAMEASEDAEVNEVRLVPQLIAQIRGMDVLAQAILWMGDRQYCDLNLMGRFTEGQDHFLIRMNKTLTFTADPGRPAQHGIDVRGRSFTQEWGWAGSVKDKRRRYLRRITLWRSQAGAEDVILLSDLLDETTYPAEDLLETYLLRWGIEKMFQAITQVFCLKQLIGCTPRANIFQAAFCFVIYNAIVVTRSYVAQAGNVKPDEVSTANLFKDVQEELIAHTKLGSIKSVVQAMKPIKTQAQMKRLLKDLLASRWRPSWRKAKCNPRKTRGRTQRVRSGRTNVFKELQKHRLNRLASFTTSQQRR